MAAETPTPSDVARNCRAMAALLGQAQKEVLGWVTGDKTAPQAGERRPRRVPRDVRRNHLYLWIKNVFAACFSGAAEPATRSSVLVTARPAAGKGIAASLSPESNKTQQPEPDAVSQNQFGSSCLRPVAGLQGARCALCSSRALQDW